ncbi:MAG: CusA/CzcA family heavy metal efflux RND transporter, partial [Balneolales bacterium]
MIQNIIRYAVRNKLIIGLLMVAWIGWGAWSLTQLSIDAVPDITDNQVRVITTTPTLATQEVEQFVTYPVELAMANLPGVKEMRSVSKMGLSIVTIVFEDEMGTYQPRQLVSEQLETARDNIPSVFGSPSIAPITTGLGEIYQYSLVVDDEFKGQYDLSELRTIHDWIVRRQLSGIPGVVEINSTGGYVKQYEVGINPERLRAMNLTLADVMQALERNNRNAGGSYVEKGPEALFIRGEGLAQSLNDLENIVVDTQNKIPVLIRDVANVQYGHAVRYGAMTRNGEGEVVGGQVLMLKGENSDKVIENVKERIEAVQTSLPEGVRIEPFIDRTRLINKTTSTVTENLVLGALIVIFFLVLLLGNIRSGLIVASVIPLAMLFAIGMMNLFGISANLMSLGALDFGIIIDGAVIIVEFTAYLISSKKTELKSLKGRQLNNRIDELAEESGSRMMSSAFFGQLIILIVFVPILTLTGVEGKMFQPMAYTFGFAMIGAILLCLTYVPAASAYFLKPEGRGELKFSQDVMDFLTYRIYRPTIRTALRNKGLVIGSAVVLLIASLYIFSRMGGEFIPQLDEGDLAVHPITKPGTSLSRVIENNTKMEKMLLEEFPEVVQVVSRTGTGEIPTDPMSLEMSDMFIILKDKEEWESADTKEELIEKIRATMTTLPGIDLAFSQPIEMRFNELMTGIREDIAIKIYGDNLDLLAELGAESREIIEGISGVADINLEQITGLPQLKIKYNRAQMARYGVEIETVNTLIQSAYAGGKAGVIYEGERRFDLVVRLDTPYVNDLESVRNLYAVAYDGDQIPLEELADIRYEDGPAQIARDNTRRRIVIGVNAGNRDVQTLVEEIRENLESELDLPAGYNITYGGQFENLQRAQSRLLFAVPLSLALIFVLLYFSLKSMKYSLLVFSAIPLATIGGVFALWIRGLPFSISAGVGFIVLFGIAVLNGIILISFFKELKNAGINDVNRQILMGTQQRLRPVLLTAATDLFGFMPMALSTAAGAEVQRPLATVVIGGLITATLLTLVVLPVLYSLVENYQARWKPSKVAGIVMLLCIISLPAFAQNTASDSLRLSQEEAVQRALERYPDIRAADLAVDRELALSKTAFEPSPTRLYISEEEVGGGSSGIESFGIQQEFEFPLKSIRKAQMGRARTDRAEAKRNLTRTQFKREVRLAWQQWSYRLEVVKVRQRITETFRTFERAARLRYETGETDQLEHLSAESLYDEYIAKLEAAK